jgi:hypothetical protein
MSEIIIKNVDIGLVAVTGIILYAMKCVKDMYCKSIEDDATRHPVIQATPVLDPAPSAPLPIQYAAPVAAPVTIPYTAPVTIPYTAPVTIPYTAPIPVPYTAPVPVPYTAPVTIPYTAPVAAVNTVPHTAAVTGPYTMPAITATPFTAANIGSSMILHTSPTYMPMVSQSESSTIHVSGKISHNSSQLLLTSLEEKDALADRGNDEESDRHHLSSGLCNLGATWIDQKK